MVAQKLLLDGYPISLQVALVGLLLAAVYYGINSYLENRPLRGFPVITLDGKDAKLTWMMSGNKAITEGIRRVSLSLPLLLSLVGV